MSILFRVLFLLLSVETKLALHCVKSYINAEPRRVGTYGERRFRFWYVWGSCRLHRLTNPRRVVDLASSIPDKSTGALPHWGMGLSISKQEYPHVLAAIQCRFISVHCGGIPMLSCCLFISERYFAVFKLHRFDHEGCPAVKKLRFDIVSDIWLGSRVSGISIWILMNGAGIMQCVIYFWDWVYLCSPGCYSQCPELQTSVYALQQQQLVHH